MENLTIADLTFIQESLKYTRLKFEDYQGYPSYEYKLNRIDEVNKVATKVNAILKELKSKI